MRHPVPFDTHAFVKELVAAGVSEAQAEVFARALADIALANLATRDDLLGLEQRMDSRLQSLEQRGESRMAALELRLTLRFGAMLAAAVGIIVAAVKLF